MNITLYQPIVPTQTNLSVIWKVSLNLPLQITSFSIIQKLVSDSQQQLSYSIHTWSLCSLRVTSFLPHANQRLTPKDQLSHIRINPDDVAEALQFLMNTKAAGTDDISALILKLYMLSLLFCITHLLNTRMLSCSIPDEWKVYKIIAIHKGSYPSDVQNRRPISLLCILSKLLESIIYIYQNDWLYSPSHIEVSVQLHKQPIMFISVVILFLLQCQLNSIQKPCYAVFLDFRKAFDTILHPELFIKLWSYGITVFF